MAKKRTLKDTAKDDLAKFVEKKPENTDTKMLNTRLPKAMIKSMKLYCVENETTIQDFMTQAVEARLKAEGF